MSETQNSKDGTIVIGMEKVIVYTVRYRGFIVVVLNAWWLLGLTRWVSAITLLVASIF